VATGTALISGGVGVAPAYGKIGLTTHVTGVLPVANGGTNASTASITSFNNITGYTASGATGTTSTDLVFSTSPAITTPSVTGDLTMSTGNVVMSNGKGIDFSATPGTGTSELFSDYEEGTWTPDQGAAVSVVGAYSSSGTYTKVGRLVTATAIQSGATSISTGSSGIIFSNLPFNVGAFSRFSGVTSMQFSAVAGAVGVSGTGNVYSAGALAGGDTIVTTISYEE
jgi:hypothetical protein